MFRSITNNVSKNLSTGGTLSGDVTITGDLTVQGGGSLSFDEIIFDFLSLVQNCQQFSVFYQFVS